MLTSPGIADMEFILDEYLEHTSRELPTEGVQNTPATVKRQIQQAENQTPAMFISVEPSHADNAILLDYLTSEVALDEPAVGSTDPNNQM